MVNDSLIFTFIVAIFLGLVGQSGAMWYKLGQLERSIKKNACPFGSCPLYERARQEAAPERLKPLEQ